MSISIQFIDPRLGSYGQINKISHFIATFMLNGCKCNASVKLWQCDSVYFTLKSAIMKIACVEWCRCGQWTTKYASHNFSSANGRGLLHQTSPFNAQFTAMISKWPELIFNLLRPTCLSYDVEIRRTERQVNANSLSNSQYNYKLLYIL